MSPRVLSPATLILLAAFSVVEGTPSTARSQSFTLLVPPSPWAYSGAYGLSADGTVAVGLAGSTLDPAHLPGTYWSASTGSMTLINEPGTPAATVANAVSGNGHVVVGSGANNTGPARAYRWSGPGTYQELSPSAGMYDSYASAVSGDGARTVGWMTTGPHTWDVTQAVYWDAAGTPTPIALLGSRAFAISRDGSTVVGDQQYLAFVWHEETGAEILPDLPGPADVGSSASAMTPDGDYIVGSSIYYPAIWHRGVVTQLFGPGGTTVVGGFSGVSDDRSVIIGYMQTPTFQTIPGIWTPVTQMIPLQDYFLANGVPVPDGVTLTRVNAISADGRTFAGSTSQHFAFVATVPSPGGFLAIVVVPFSLALRRRHRILF